MCWAHLIKWLVKITELGLERAEFVASLFPGWF